MPLRRGIAGDSDPSEISIKIPRHFRRVSVKQLNPPYEVFIGRIFAYSFDAEASKAPSDEGGFGAVQNRRSYNTPIGV